MTAHAYRNIDAWDPWGVTVRDVGGPTRVATEDPPADWTPPPPVGFSPPRSSTSDVPPRTPDVSSDQPLLWDGDQG